MPAVVAAKHCFVASIAVAFVARESSWLEILTPTATGVGAPRIELTRADDVAYVICDALTLRDWIFVHPINATLLYGEQAAPLINVTTRPVCVLVGFGNDLSAD